MSEEQPHKHRRWRGPIIAFVLGIPVISAVIVTSITLLFLYSANALRLSWDSLGAIGLSLLVSFALLFIVFLLGIVFTLQVLVRIVGAVLEDIFPHAKPKERSKGGGHAIDEFLLNMAHAFMMPHLPNSQPDREDVVEAVPHHANEQEA